MSDSLKMVKGNILWYVAGNLKAQMRFDKWQDVRHVNIASGMIIWREEGNIDLRL